MIETDKQVFYARCINQLKAWEAPLEGWYCVEVIDVREDELQAPLSECELCGCKKVRFKHVMMHDHYFKEVTVGCVCAGIMEGDILKARERERMMRNRARRRWNFLKRPWKPIRDGAWKRRYKKHDLLIWWIGSHYMVGVDGDMSAIYKGRYITDYCSAVFAAFDLADPLEWD